MREDPGTEYLSPSDGRIHPSYYYGGRPEVRMADTSSPFSAMYWRQHFKKVALAYQVTSFDQFLTPSCDVQTDHERHERYVQGRCEIDLVCCVGVSDIGHSCWDVGMALLSGTGMSEY